MFISYSNRIDLFGTVAFLFLPVGRVMRVIRIRRAKIFYFRLFERKYAQKANKIAVSSLRVRGLVNFTQSLVQIDRERNE